MPPLHWRGHRILDAWGRPGEPQRTLVVLDRLERAGAISRVEHQCALQFHHAFAQVALAPLPAADPRRGSELGVLRQPIENAAEHIPAVDHIVRTLSRLAAQDTDFARVAWVTLGLGCPFREHSQKPGASTRRLIATLRALRRCYGLSDRD